MNKFISVILFGLLTFILLTSMSVRAVESNIQIDSSSDHSLDITRRVKILETTKELSITDILSKTSNFTQNNQTEVKQDYSKKALWINFEISNRLDKEIEKVLYLSSTTSGVVEMYILDELNELFRSEISGNSISYHKRKVNSLTPAFKLTLNPYQKINILLKRTSRHRLDTKIYLIDEDQFYKEDSQSKYILVLYAGAILAISLYNFFILLFTRDITYLYYCLFATSLSSLVLNLHGALDYFFRFQSFIFSKYILLCSSSSIFFMLCFAFYFLKVENSFRKYIKGFKVLGAISLAHMAISITPLFDTYSNYLGVTIDLTIASSLIFVLIVSINGVLNRNIIAKIYLISFVFIFSGAAIWFGVNLGIFPKNIFTTNSLLIANLVEMITIALGLAYKITYIDQTQLQIKKEKLSHQRYLRLVRVLTHDISNSLLIITGYSKKVLRSPELVDKSSTWEKISRASSNIANILNQVREEIRNDEKFKLELRDVRINSILGETLFTFNEKLKSKNINIHNLIDDSLVIYAEPTILQNHIFNNIISNAIKFSKENSSIYILYKATEDYNVIKVKDSGVGITSKDINNFMKNKFIETKTGTKGEQGTGQGMKLLHGYMEKFGGHVELESVSHTEDSLNSGTTVILYFPKVH